jgi:hypothetical protein
MCSEIVVEGFKIHPNLKQLSHSSSTTLHGCPRRYELYKLSPNDPVEGRTIHTVFGHAVGTGTQELLVSGDYNQAVIKAFAEYPWDLEDEDGAKPKKTFYHAVHAIDRFQGFKASELGQYSIPLYKGKPAIELGYTIDCGDGWIHRGFLDALMIHNMTGEFEVFEGKTTASWNVHPAMYQNSGQGLGYSCIVDAICAESGVPLMSGLKVNYCVYQTTGDMDWRLLQFVKNYTQRALWIKQLLRDIQHISEYGDDGYFPLHGENCYSFGRQCEYFGVCEMKTANLVPNPKVKLDDPAKYTFHFKLEDIIEAQMQKQDVLMSLS